MTFLEVGFGGNLVLGFRAYAWGAVPSFPQIALCFPSLALRPQPFWNCLIKICVISCDMNSTLGSVVPLAMFYVCLFLYLYLYLWSVAKFPFSLELLIFVSNNQLQVIIYFVWRLVVLHYETLSNKIEDPRFADLSSKSSSVYLYFYR